MRARTSTSSVVWLVGVVLLGLSTYPLDLAHKAIFLAGFVLYSLNRDTARRDA